jgi:competence ComEA-like helix-hairpin-helix protein
MSLYNRHQLALILALLAAAAAGLAVGHWRRAHPEFAMELESLGRPVDTASTAAAAVRHPGSPDAYRLRHERRARHPGEEPGTRADHRGHQERTGDDHVPARTEPVAVPIAPDGGAPVTTDTPGARTSGPVNVNRATAAELARLPGIGPVLAERIVEARASSGRFASIDELRRVAGVGRWKLERVRTLIFVEQ